MGRILYDGEPHRRHGAGRDGNHRRGQLFMDIWVVRFASAISERLWQRVLGLSVSRRGMTSKIW